MKRILNINNFSKINEDNINSREVDLQQLWNNFWKHKKEILKYIDNKNHLLNDYDYFVYYILTPIFNDKLIEFHRSKNILDDEIIYGFKGIVKDISLKIDKNKIIILVNLYNHKDTYIMANLDFFYDNLIPKSDKNNLLKIIKVYDSNITVIENIIDSIEDIKKYNL